MSVAGSARQCFMDETMHTMSDDNEPVLRNLSDAACPNETIERFMALRSEGRMAEQVKLLQAHRKILLDTIHDGQRSLDCLDYLLFTMKKDR